MNARLPSDQAKTEQTEAGDNNTYNKLILHKSHRVIHKKYIYCHFIKFLLKNSVLIHNRSISVTKNTCKVTMFPSTVML